MKKEQTLLRRINLNYIAISFFIRAMKIPHFKAIQHHFNELWCKNSKESKEKDGQNVALPVLITNFKDKKMRLFTWLRLKALSSS